MLELKEKDTYMYIKETTKESIYSDVFTLWTLLMSFWLNYTFIWGNNFLDLLIFLWFFAHIWNVAKKIRKFQTMDELIEFLQSNNKKDEK